MDKEINFILEDTHGEFITTRVKELLHISVDSKEIRLGIKNPVNPSSFRIKNIRLITAE